MRILLVDDNEELLEAIAEFFSDHRHTAECATESEEAVAMIRHHHYDVAIVDLELNSIEGLDGFGVLKALRQSCPQTKVIVYSCHSSEAIIAAALRHGGTQFIKKPVLLKKLLASAEEMCPTLC